MCVCVYIFLYIIYFFPFRDTNTKPNIPPMYNMNTNNYVDSPNMNENIDMIKLYPYNNNFNINYNNFRNLYEESQYNLFNFYNPALHIFPIDRSFAGI